MSYKQFSKSVMASLRSGKSNEAALRSAGDPPEDALIQGIVANQHLRSEIAGIADTLAEDNNSIRAFRSLVLLLEHT